MRLRLLIDESLEGLLATLKGLETRMDLEVEHYRGQAIPAGVTRPDVVFLSGALEAQEPASRLGTHVFRVGGQPGPATLPDSIDEGSLEAILDLCREAACRERQLAETRGAHERLVSTQKQLLQVEKLSSLGQLSAGIAHEINNPLFVIMGNLELALERSAGRVQGFIQKALTNAERIKRIVLDLREFYAPSRNELVELNLNGILENAVPIVTLQASGAPIQFELELQPDLPAICGDDNQLLQVFSNLLLNSIQAMPKGGVVGVRSRLQGQQVVVDVSDTGVGIPPENLGRVFDPFFTTKRDRTGTGLGLSVTYTIIENHSGTIEVASELGRGTTFTVRLPAVPPSIRIAEPAPPSERRQVAIRNTGCQVLVSDEDEATRDYVRALLTEAGLVADAAGNAAQTLERLLAVDYGLVVLDLRVAGPGGFACSRAELLETIRRIVDDEPAP
ncbi:MAG: hypothetical protein HY814_12455 [Candidatus Riflebacteria bacterium]|nr:hypothetical protein [Candidatus Riflebacteria bacterium]